jgi:SAC3 family protein LENG8/THP3
MMSSPPWRVGVPREFPAPRRAHSTTDSRAGNGAFTSVPARKSFIRPVPTPEPMVISSFPPSRSMQLTILRQAKPQGQPSPIQAEPPRKPPKVDWPDSVRHYVQRAFVPDHEVPGIGREEMEKKLKEFIQLAHDNGTMYTIDWEALPLPQEMILRERQKSDVQTSAWQERNLDGAAESRPEVKSNKRKSWELHHSRTDEEAAQPPWRKTNPRTYFENRNVFEDHASLQSPSPPERPEKRSRKYQDDPSGKGSSKFDSKLEKRSRRFEDNRSSGFQSPKHPWSSRNDSPSPVANEGPIVGRCQDLEKKYFRLTSAPNPDVVRPLPVLQKTLEVLKKKWKKENNYSYICDQFKSLRQDLTVQHIKNEFTVTVYEIHARIALEKGDIGEYNQCQTQLRVLYSQNLGGHPMEFKAYRILYFIHTCNRTDMNDILADLTPAEKMDPAVKHALDVRSALALGNYHRFFRLYLDTPNMGAYLMDMFIVRERLSALANICRAYVALAHLIHTFFFNMETVTNQMSISDSLPKNLASKAMGSVFSS